VVEPPGDAHQAVHQQAFDLVGGRDRGMEGVVAGAEGLGILAGQDEGLGAEAVLQSVETGSLGVLRARRALRVFSTCSGTAG
jgi:hypothetical protein